VFLKRKIFGFEKIFGKNCIFQKYFSKKQEKTRENAIVEYLDYQIPVTQLNEPKEYGDMQAVKRD